MSTGSTGVTYVQFPEFHMSLDISGIHYPSSDSARPLTACVNEVGQIWKRLISFVFDNLFLTELIQRSFSTTSKSQASASSALSGLSACW